MPQSPHFGAVPRFLMWRTLVSPPGVLMMRVRLEVVLYLQTRPLLAEQRFEVVCHALFLKNVETETGGQTDGLRRRYVTRVGAISAVRRDENRGVQSSSH